MVDLSKIKFELSPEQIQQLNKGIGSIMRPTDIYKLGWDCAMSEVSKLLKEENNP